MKRKIVWLLLAVAVLALTACSAGGENQTTKLPPEPEDGVLIYAALNPVTNELQSSIDRFNESHTDAQIEIQDYSDENGPQRLLVELSVGRIPDIMEMHRFGGSGRELRAYKSFLPLVTDRPVDEYWMPYRQLAQKGYLEDLWPCIERDPELGRAGVLEAPLKAAEVNGGLYILFKDVIVASLMGPESIVGERYGWTFDELMAAYSTMPEGSTILRYNSTKWDVFSKLLCFTLDQYVDWDAGRCSFDSEEFRNMLVFLNDFPDETEFATPKETNGEIVWRLKNGRQMLESVLIGRLDEITYRDTLWKERVAFPGYPTAEGQSGNYFMLRGNILAMSSACQNKDAAWDFIRRLVRNTYSLNMLKIAEIAVNVSIPVNLKDYNFSILANLEKAKEIDLKKNPESLPPWSLFPDDSYPIYPEDEASEKDVPRFKALIDNTTQIYWPNDALANIVWEACGPYFAGDKTLDETVSLIQNRVQLYVNENR